MKNKKLSNKNENNSCIPIYWCCLFSCWKPKPKLGKFVEAIADATSLPKELVGIIAEYSKNTKVEDALKQREDEIADDAMKDAMKKAYSDVFVPLAAPALGFGSSECVDTHLEALDGFRIEMVQY